MGQNKKITDKQLKKELKKGKTYKQIAQEYGYRFPSRTLSQRIRDLGFEKNSKLSFYESGGANFSTTSNTINELLRKNGLEDADKVYYNYDVENGSLVIRFYSKEWRSEK